MTKTFKLVEGAANITKLIASVTRTGKKLEVEMHSAAVACLNHAGLHGDITLANRLLEGLPSGIRKNALRDWFINFGKFKWDDETKELAFDKAKVTLLEDAIAMPFWEFKVEQAFKPMDLAASINQILQRANKSRENGQKFSKEEDAVLNALREMVVG